MTDAEFVEFIIVVIELGVFMLYLSVGAVILEVIYPKLVKLVKQIAIRVKIRKIKRRILSGIKVQNG